MTSSWTSSMPCINSVEKEKHYSTLTHIWVSCLFHISGIAEKLSWHVYVAILFVSVDAAALVHAFCCASRAWRTQACHPSTPSFLPLTRVLASVWSNGRFRGGRTGTLFWRRSSVNMSAPREEFHTGGAGWLFPAVLNGCVSRVNVRVNSTRLSDIIPPTYIQGNCIKTLRVTQLQLFKWFISWFIQL